MSTIPMDSEDKGDDNSEESDDESDDNSDDSNDNFHELTFEPRPPKTKPNLPRKYSKHDKKRLNKKIKEKCEKIESRQLRKQTEKIVKNRNNPSKDSRKIQNLQKEDPNCKRIPFFLSTDNFLHNISTVFFKTISKDVIEKIFSYLSPPERTQMYMVCQSLHSLLKQWLPRSPFLSSVNLNRHTSSFHVNWKGDTPKEFDGEAFFLFIRLRKTWVLTMKLENTENKEKSGVATTFHYFPNTERKYCYFKLVVVNCFGSSSSQWVKLKLNFIN